MKFTSVLAGTLVADRFGRVREVAGNRAKGGQERDNEKRTDYY